VAFDSYSKENNICKTEYGDEEFRRMQKLMMHLKKIFRMS
jgi:hypothetical protein